VGVTTAGVVTALAVAKESYLLETIRYTRLTVKPRLMAREIHCLVTPKYSAVALIEENSIITLFSTRE
jgi:hypothetical protein